MSMTLADLAIRVDSTDVSRGTQSLQGLTEAGGKAERSTLSLGRSMAALGLGAAAAGVAFARLKDVSLEYAASMREISTLVNTATFDVSALSKAAIAQAGAFNSQPITQTKALYQIISAGASSAAQATDTLTAANKLAVGGVTSVAIAADGLTSVMNAYGDKVSGAAAVSDAMFIAVRNGKTTIAELSSSLGVIAPLAASTGVSFDELTAATAALTKGGISTSESITGLRAILAAVARPSDEAAKLSAKLGLEFNSTALASKGLAGFLADLQTKTGGNTDALAKLFGGVEALVPVMALSGRAGRDFTAILDQMAGKAGATEEAFDKIASGAAFQLGRIFATITSNAIGLAAALAEKAAPGLKAVADNLGLVAAAGAVVAVVIGTNALVSFTSFAVAAIGASTAVRAYALSVALIGPASATAAVLTAGLGAAMRGLLAAATSTTAVLSALFIGLGAIAMASAKAGAQVQSLDAATDRAKDVIDNYAASTREAGVANGAVGTSAAGAVGSISAAGNAAGIAADKFWLMAAAAKEAAAAANFKQIADLQGEISRTESLTRAGRRRIDGSSIASVTSGGVNLLAGDIKSFLTAGDSDRALENSLAGAKKQMEGLVAIGQKLLAQDFETPLRAQAAGHNAVSTAVDGETKKRRAAKEAIDAQVKAYEDAIKAGQAYIDSQQRQLEAFGVSERGLQRMAAAREIDNIRTEASLAPNAAARDILLQIASAAATNAAEIDRAAGVTERWNKGLAELNGKLTVFDSAAITSGIEDSAAKSLTDSLQALQALDTQAQRSASSMEESFGRIGKSMGGVLTAFSSYRVAMKALAIQEKDGLNVAKERASTQVGVYGDMAGAAKGFFDEQSAGYQLLQRAESAFRLLQFALSVRAMATKTAEAGVSVAANGAITASGIAAGAANIFAQLGPWAFPVVGAMVAVMAGLGAKTGGGGGATPGATDMADRQKTQGTGSVLGDSAAQSASIANALKAAESNWNKDLEYSNGMLKALRSIDGNMGVLAAALARSLSAGGALDTSGLNLGTSSAGPGLVQKILNPISMLLPGLFGSTTTRTLQDQGLQFDSGSLSDILAGGIQGQTYQQVLENQKKKFLGITYSDKNTVSTSFSGLDDGVASQITLLIASLRDGVLTAAATLGVEGADATLAAFTVNLGKLSFKDMTGQEIQDALNAVFSKLGDDMAAAAIPALSALQKVGEGTFETLVRVARQYQVVDISLSSIGMTFGAVGVASLAARERLVDLSGGLDAFAEGVTFFADNFLSETERLAPIQKAVSAEFARLGLAADLTRDQFKGLVLGLDLSSEAGAGMYAALINVAPAFAKVLDYTDALAASAKELADSKAAEALQKAVETQATQVGLMRQLQAMDDAVLGTNVVLLATRAEELAKLDDVSQGLQKIIWAREDEAKVVAANTAALEAANAKAAEILKQRTSLEDQLLTAMGRTSEATARQRAATLAGLDPSLRGLQSAYDAVTDANARVTAAETGVADARSALTEAYDRESSALKTTIDRFKGFTDSLRAFRDQLMTGDIAANTPALQYSRTKADFERVAGLASQGNEQALGDLQGVSEAYLKASGDYQRTNIGYFRDLSAVKNATKAAEGYASQQVDTATAQLAALDASVSGLMTVNASVLSVRDAIAGMSVALSELASANGNKTQADAAAQAALQASKVAGVTIGANDNADVAAAKALYLSSNGGIDSATFDRYVGANPFATMKRVGYDGDPEALRKKYGFATGGSFTVGGSGGPDSQIIPLHATPGEIVSVRRPGDGGDNSELVAEIRALRAEVAALRTDGAKTAQATTKTANILTRVTRDGDNLVTVAA